jgi:UDP-N-acetylglucosamine 2-epimerase (non-hydrolysing)
MSATPPLVHLIAGARPNFMKIAPLMRALKADGRLAFQLIHTGQHFDREMNEVFFEELGIPEPDKRLGCGGGSQAEQTAKIMVAYEQYLQESRPDCTLVVGDVNSTLACALVAKKAGIPVAHVEAGLRSGDMAMPEEVNRIATDAITDWFFVTEPSGTEHLLQEGKKPAVVYDVGHVMVDNLLYQDRKLREAFDVSALESDALKRQLGRYAVVTLHRPSNVDGEDNLRRAVGVVNEVARSLPVVFPVHPRTRKSLEAHGIALDANVHLLGPQAYMSFLHLWRDAALVLTDSGGLQEETTALGVPCVTMRESTERPITVTEGSNILAGTDPARVLEACRQVLAGQGKAGRRPLLWDGRAAERIVQVLTQQLGA